MHKAYETLKESHHGITETAGDDRNPLAEATQHLDVLARAMAAQDVSVHERQQAMAHGTPAPQPQYTLQAERDWWEKAHHGLTVVQNAFEHIATSERERGVMTPRAGA